MQATIAATIDSLRWVDGIYLLDDNSSDDTVRIAQQAAAIPIIVERSPFEQTAFDWNERLIRNHVMDRAFEQLRSDYLISIDADELMSELLKNHIAEMPRLERTSLSLTIWHLFDR